MKAAKPSGHKSSCGKEASPYPNSSQNPQKESSPSTLTKSFLSLLIVDTMILPAVTAGLCYFVLRTVDDIITIYSYARRRRTRPKLETQKKDEKSNMESISETKPKSEGGISSAHNPYPKSEPGQSGGRERGSIEKEDHSRSEEAPHPTAAGIVGLVIVAGVVKLIQYWC